MTNATQIVRAKETLKLTVGPDKDKHQTPTWLRYLYGK